MCFAGKCDHCKKQVGSRAYWHGLHLCTKCCDLIPLDPPTQADLDEVRRILNKK